MIGSLLAMQNQFRMFHWQTESYAQHKAFGEAYEGLDELVDEFVEVYQGKNGIVVPGGGVKLKLENLDSKPVDMIDVFVDYLTNDLPKELKKEDTDLLNIRDEMLGLLNKTKYLLLLK
jgi:DNA-binding ferritin-like protein